MSRKDYRRFAALIAEIRARVNPHDIDLFVLLDSVEHGLSRIFLEDNPLFNAGRFSKACREEPSEEPRS